MKGLAQRLSRKRYAFISAISLGEILDLKRHPFACTRTIPAHHIKQIKKIKLARIKQNIIDTLDRIATINQHQFAYVTSKNRFNYRFAKTTNISSYKQFGLIKAFLHLVEVYRRSSKRFNNFKRRVLAYVIRWCSHLYLQHFQESIKACCGLAFATMGAVNTVAIKHQKRQAGLFEFALC